MSRYITSLNFTTTSNILDSRQSKQFLFLAFLSFAPFFASSLFTLSPIFPFQHSYLPAASLRAKPADVKCVDCGHQGVDRKRYQGGKSYREDLSRYPLLRTRRRRRSHSRSRSVFPAIASGHVEVRHTPGGERERRHRHGEGLRRKNETIRAKILQ